MHLFNLDPAAEKFDYTPSVDIRDLIGLEDVMDELDYGPNGGLIYCFEYVQLLRDNFARELTFGHRYLLSNLDWLHEAMGDYEDDYLIIDCPGTSLLQEGLTKLFL